MKIRFIIATLLLAATSYAEPKPIPEGRWILKGLQFEKLSLSFNKASTAILDEVVETLKANPTVKIEVQGHTDSYGKPNLNMLLSQQRADKVADYLISKGIEKDRIQAIGYGEDEPITDNFTLHGRNTNRRIELKVLP